MIWASVGCFAIAALGGVTMAGMMWGGRKPPLPLAVFHGLLAVTGLSLFVLSAMPFASSLARAGLALFCVAAFGGLILLSFHLRGRRLPTPLIVVHGLLAATGFAILVVHAIGAA